MRSDRMREPQIEKEQKTNEGGGGKSELPTLEDGTGVRDAVKNLPVLISVLIHNA